MPTEPTQEKPVFPEKEFGDTLIRSALQSWIVPELNRRQRSGALADAFEFYAGQVVMELGQPLEVRLNEEVHGVIVLRPESSLSPGVEVPVSRFERIAAEVQSFRLQDEDRPNAAHLTLVRNGAGWFVTFDFRYNSARIAEHLTAAREFISSAAANLAASRLRPFVNDLFGAVELMAKARLMVHPDERILRSKKHSFTMSNYNLFVNQGNADKRFADLLNRLADLRNPARFPDGAFSLPLADASEMLNLAREMDRQILTEIPHRAVRATQTRNSSSPDLELFTRRPT
jgi:uncharacterized protein (UPF0332 family)